MSTRCCVRGIEHRSPATGPPAAGDREEAALSPPDTADPEPAPWWRHAVIYQVYPRSFADSNGDGVGDLPGCLSRLDHLVELGVDALWLSPFYTSPHVDAGYDVADHRDVDPVFGTLSDMDKLLAAAHERGLRVIVDLVPNHTSDEHPWFREALAAGPGSLERARYVFRDGHGPDGAKPPNAWLSVLDGPAWTRVPDGQWYLHLYDASQPDLNWHNSWVRDRFEEILRWWLDRGVDGFRVDVAHGLVKAPGLPEWSPDPVSGDSPVGRRGPMWDQDGVHDIYRTWRRIVDTYPGERILVAEAFVAPAERLMRYVRPDEMHQAFNFTYLFTPWRAADQRAVISASLASAGSVGAPATWVLSNHDVIRHATRFGFPPGTRLPRGISTGDPAPDHRLGLRRARAATLLMLALPGSAYLYQGEELGLVEDIWLPDEARQDPIWRRSQHRTRGRDGCRVPLPWCADAPSFGFGPGERCWLPQPPVWAEYALDRQRGVAASTYEMYRAALRLRRAHRLGSGELRWVDLGSEVVAFTSRALLVVANLGATPVPLPDGVQVRLSSGPLEGDAVPPDTAVFAEVGVD
jgi:alpha-glucosidase